MKDIPLEIVLNSHFNDISMEMSIGTEESIGDAKKRLRFVKFLTNLFRNQKVEDVWVSDEELKEWWRQATS